MFVRISRQDNRTDRQTAPHICLVEAHRIHKRSSLALRREGVLFIKRSEGRVCLCVYVRILFPLPSNWTVNFYLCRQLNYLVAHLHVRFLLWSSNAFWPFGCFFLVVRPPLFGIGRGPITPPGPAMVVIDRKDLNSKTKKKTTVLQSRIHLHRSMSLSWASYLVGLNRRKITVLFKPKAVIPVQNFHGWPKLESAGWGYSLSVACFALNIASMDGR